MFREIGKRLEFRKQAAHHAYRQAVDEGGKP
jgi:hypothetical protein